MSYLIRVTMLDCTQLDECQSIRFRHRLKVSPNGLHVDAVASIVFRLNERKAHDQTCSAHSLRYSLAVRMNKSLNWPNNAMVSPIGNIKQTFTFLSTALFPAIQMIII